MTIEERVTSALADMQSLIVFDSKNHVYRHRETDFWFQGVSSVSSIVPKDWLAAWGAKEAVKALGYNDYGDMTVAEATLKRIKSMDVKQFHALLKDSKGASSRKSKEALVDGKLGHHWLEMYVKARIEGTPVPLIPIGTPLERPIRQFKAWEALNRVEYIASEKYVVNEAKLYAGTFDAIAMINGKLCLIDFKFASHISEDYSLQTAGYCAAFEKYGITFDERVIIRLPKSLEREEYVDYKYRLVPNDIEVHYIKTRYESDRDAFYAALTVKAWINSNTK
jgi:hypothetical protein